MPTPSPTPAVPIPESLTFEQAMAQLEAIVERMESGQIGLEQALAEYERGVALVKRCREVLQRAELKVEELSALIAPSEEEPDGEDGR
jgi:exodeoxyribonuclease VII small subunit